MEDVLNQLAEECNSHRQGNIIELCRKANDLLESQSDLLQCPPSSLRAICFHALQDALESKNPRLISLAVSGFQKLLRDNQFYSSFDEDDETQRLPNQLIGSLCSLSSHTDEIQVELLKVIINMSSLHSVNVSGHLAVQIIGISGLAYGRGTQAIRSTSQAAAGQTIAALISRIKEKSFSQGQLEFDEESIYNAMAPAFDEVVPIVNFLTDRLADSNKNSTDKRPVAIPPLFLLECINSILRSISSTKEEAYQKNKGNLQDPVNLSALFLSSLWQRLCPTLVGMLGPISNSSSVKLSLEGNLYETQESKLIYSIACNLVICLGHIGEMRPVIECLFQRMLLHPPVYHRFDAIRAITELLSSPSHMIQIAGPILEPDPSNPYQCDLALFRLMLDSLCEAVNNENLQFCVCECILNTLCSLECLCKDEILPFPLIKIINQTYQKLADVDYSGPLTYENQLNLAKDHKTSKNYLHESLKMKNVDVCTSDLEHEGENENIDDDCSISSGNTEGPEEKEECPLTNDGDEEESKLLRLSNDLGSNSNLRHTKEEELEVEIANANHFCTTLKAFIPSVLSIRSTIEVDQAMMEFASKYCQGVFTETSEKSCRIIINADGVYLASYSALALNLKLIRTGFYCGALPVPSMNKLVM